MGVRGYGQSGQSTAPTDSSTTTPTTATPTATAPTTATETTPTPAAQPSARPEKAGRIGVGIKVSLLGAGIEAAARVNRHSNVRGGFNMITYDRTFHNDTNTYGGQLAFKTIEAHYDWFPFAGGFHVSGGLLAYIGDPLSATISTKSFKLNGTTYYPQSSTTMITGTGKIDFDRVSPTITIGRGNLVPRRHNKHFTVPFEIGVAFQGPPKATLNLNGEVCPNQVGTNCVPAATDPTVHKNILAEQNKLNNDMSFFKEYPIISVGFGYKF
jgi:hypothetical protein